MKVRTLVVGPIQENCHLIEDADELLVVDPGAEPERILAAVGEHPVRGIVCTHYHWDHVGAVAALQEATGAGLALGATDAPRLDGVSNMEGHDIAQGHEPAHVTRLLHGGDVVQVGQAAFAVIDTPGHTPGGICLHCAAQGLLIAGDTLFAGGSFGRTDFADGDFSALVASISGKLSQLPDATRVLCGHGSPTTIGAERRLNPFLR